MENARKEFWRTWRMRVKNFAADGERSESSFVFADHIKTFSIYAKRILAYRENTQKEFKRE